jgi:high affinity sulfate transporter 1
MSEASQSGMPALVGEAPTGVRKWLPGLQTARAYKRGFLRCDITAGLILTALLVPAGMGYASAAGLPPIYGLYATIVPLIAYAIFGPSRILVLGPDSSLAPLIAAAILPVAAGDSAEAVALAAMLALLVGGVFVIAGVARLGFITDLLSKPVRYGYLNGIALTVLVSQLPKLFGFSIDAEGVGPSLVAFVRGVFAGETVSAALIIGAGSLAIIFGFKRWLPKVPGVLVAVVLSTLAVWLLDLAAAGVPVVGPVPRGLPSFKLPAMDWADLGTMVAAALGIFLVAFADTSVLSRTFALRGGYKVDPDQEMVALGIANAAAGLFQGFPISSSASRTPVAEAAGAKTQLTGIVGAAAIALLLVFAPTLLKDLPTAALAAVVIAAAFSIFQYAGVRRLYRERRSEFVLSILTFLGVVVFGVLIGMGVAVAVSLLDFIRRAWRPHDAVLGRVDQLDGYHDILRYPQARQIPGLMLYRWDAPLFFANAEMFGSELRRHAGESQTTVRWVIVAAEPITDVDTTAADVLVELDKDLTAAGIELAFAEMKDPVKDRLVRYGLADRIGRQRFYPTLGSSIKAYLKETGVEWVDWEDARKRAAKVPSP